MSAFDLMTIVWMGYSAVALNEAVL